MFFSVCSAYHWVDDIEEDKMLEMYVYGIIVRAFGRRHDKLSFVRLSVDRFEQHCAVGGKRNCLISVEGR
jgi:hypothetical protein